MFKRKLAACLIAAMLGTALVPMNVAAAGNNIAKIGDVEYATLDAAVAAAADGDTIEVLQNCKTEGIKVTGKAVTIQGDENSRPVIDFTNKGIAILQAGEQSGNLTFKDCVLDLVGTKDNPEQTGENILINFQCALNLDNTNLTLEPADGYTGYGIFLHGGGELNVEDGSDVVVKNFNGIGASGIYCEADRISDPDDGLGIYSQINFKDSSLTVSGCAWGGMTVNCVNTTVDHSTVYLSGNGVNGGRAGYNSYYGTLTVTNNAVFTAENNVGSKWGIFADDLTVENGGTINAVSNTGDGLVIGGNALIDSTAKANLNKNTGSGLWIYKSGTTWAGDCTIESGAAVVIAENKNSGIYNTNRLVMNAGLVTNNTAAQTGGGILTKGEFVTNDEVRIHNNHAGSAGDDVYVLSGGSAVLSDAQSSEMIVLDDCAHVINGWYDDANDSRWNADDSDSTKHHIVRVTGDALGTVAAGTALKAAHDIEGKTSYPGLVKKIIKDDNTLTDSTTAAKEDVVDFRLTSEVPDDLVNYLNPEVASPSQLMKAARAAGERGSYELVFHDVMDSSLNLVEESIAVTIGDKMLSRGEHYLVQIPAEDNHTFDIVMDLATLYRTGIISNKDLGITPIVVTYKATLDSEIKAGTYENMAFVTYPEGESEEDKVIVDTFGLSIFKYDQTTQAGLAGAQFELYQKSDDGKTKINTIVLESGEDGYIILDGLKDGTYYLQETQAPDGYVANQTELQVIISKTTSTENVVTVKFANGQIPHTGGEGTGLYTMVGLVVMIGAAGAFIISRRKKHEN